MLFDGQGLETCETQKFANSYTYSNQSSDRVSFDSHASRYYLNWTMHKTNFVEQAKKHINSK